MTAGGPGCVDVPPCGLDFTTSYNHDCSQTKAKQWAARSARTLARRLRREKLAAGYRAKLLHSGLDDEVLSRAVTVALSLHVKKELQFSSGEPRHYLGQAVALAAESGTYTRDDIKCSRKIKKERDIAEHGPFATAPALTDLPLQLQVAAAIAKWRGVLQPLPSAVTSADLVRYREIVWNGGALSAPFFCGVGHTLRADAPVFFPATRGDVIGTRSDLRDPMVLRDTIPTTMSPMTCSTSVVGDHINGNSGIQIDFNSCVFQLEDDDIIQTRQAHAREVDYTLQVWFQLQGCHRRLRTLPAQCDAINVLPRPGPPSTVAAKSCVFRNTQEVFDSNVANRALSRTRAVFSAFRRAWWEFHEDLGITLCGLEDAEAEGYYNEELAYAEDFTTTLGRVFRGTSSITRAALTRLIAGGFDDDGGTTAQAARDTYITTLIGDASSVNVLAWALAHAGNEFHYKTVAASRIQKWWIALNTTFAPRYLVDGEDWMREMPTDQYRSWREWLLRTYIAAHPGCDDASNDDYYIDRLGDLAEHYLLEGLRGWEIAYMLVRSGFTEKYPDGLTPKLRMTGKQILAWHHRCKASMRDS